MTQQEQIEKYRELWELAGEKVGLSAEGLRGAQADFEETKALEEQALNHYLAVLECYVAEVRQ